MPRNDTVLTPTPTRENFGSGTLEGIVRVVGNSIEVAGSTATHARHQQTRGLIGPKDALWKLVEPGNT
jgi:hypothetical protein